MKTVMLLGAGVESIPIVQRVRDLDFRSVVVDGDANAPGRGVADLFVQASCYHGDQAIAGLRASGLTFDGVLCAAVDAPIVAAEVAAAFGLPGLSVEAARLSGDKLAQKHALFMARVSVPPFADMTDARVAFAEHARDGRWVSKPIDSRGARGAIRLLPSVDPAWAYEQAKSHSPTGRVMVEQWLDGPQLSTESIVQNGRVLFTAVGLRNYARLEEFAPFVIEDGFDEPFVDSPIASFEIDNVIYNACRALGWYQQGTGIVKGDLVIHNGRVYVIELAARLSGGFFATHGHPLAYGVDFVGAAIKAALGYTLEEPKPYARGFVSQRYVFPARDDIGKTVSELPVLLNLDAPSFNYDGMFWTWSIKEGQRIRPVDCHPARWGQALAVGRTPDEARIRAEAAVAAMKTGVILNE